MTVAGTDGYYGSPIIKRPVWTWEIPAYFAVGGTAGASAILSGAARAIGDDELAEASARVAAVAGAASPILLISDLGRPERFLNMLRVIRPTSPMNVGAWLLSAFVPAAAVCALGTVRSVPASILLPARVCSTVLGAGMSAYTAVLVSDTAVPAWHEARDLLPYLFAGSAMAGAGAAGVLTSHDRTGLATSVATLGGVSSVAMRQLIENRGRRARESYGEGDAGRLGRWSAALIALGVAGLGFGRRRRWPGLLGAVSVLVGTFLERFSVMRAGVQSADDPRHVIGSQRDRS